MKSLAQRRQSAPSLVLSKALNKSRTNAREVCFSPISPETCPLVQSFLCPTRTFLLDGHVQLKTGLQTQERHLFLFTDIIVVAKPKSQLHFKLKSQARISEMWTASCMEEVCEGSTSLEKSFVLGWPTTNCVASFSSVEQKEKWLTSLQSRIKEEKAKDYPKSIPLKIIAKDVGNCAYSKTLTVTNMDTANDVILMALQQLGINGCEKDYQLWVNSGKEDAPYPLIGHEYPFGIKMSHIRDTLPQMQGSKDCVCPLDLQGAFLMEQLPCELQCQFILKPSRLATGHELNELSQKPFKRKRSIINWAFWRGVGAPVDNAPPSSASPVSGKLFGLSLPAICENDNLPKPVLDMLSFLYQEGPFTRGIFRRSANAKSCRELKEKLDSGDEVHLLCESIFVTASVFKDFLRNIPGSIFSSQLCDQWVSLMDEGNHEEKIKSIHRLMEQLPSANVMLLRYLFGVLHSIEKQSEDNQMTAFNLSVCIAPSLLWPPAPASPGTEGEFMKKVSILVQFLIENCCRIFGEDFTSIFADVVPKNDNREDGSDLSSFHLNDSSYDSLDNELNDCADSSFNNLLKKWGHENRSRDSVLTLSDCDLDPPESEVPQIKLPAKSQPVSISAGFHHKSPSREHSENESLCSITSGYSSTTISDVHKSSRRHRRCSEPTIGLLASNFTPLSGFHETAVRKASCDAVLSHMDENYLKQLRSLQVEGQKLMNQSVVMGIDVGKDSPESHTSEKKEISNCLLPPPPLRLNICSRTSCSSLSSPGTSPSGSSMSSLDSAFSQFSDYSVFTPTETSSPLDCTFHSQRKYGEVSPDFNPFSCVGSSPSTGHNSSLVCAKKESLEWPPHKSPVTLHPSTWLKSGASTMKSWTLRKKDKASKQEEKKNSSIKITLESQASPVDTSKSNLCQKQQQNMVSSFANEVTVLSVDQESCPPQGAGQFTGLPFCPVEVKDKRLKALELLAEQSKEEEEEESSSFFPSHKRQPSCFNARDELKTEPNAVLNAACQCVTEENLSKSAHFTEIAGHKAVPSKNDKSLSSQASKITDASSEREFCAASPILTEAENDLSFQSISNNSFPTPQNGADASKTKKLKKLYGDPKFEEMDKKIFTEESYV
ncbi:rho GTPase-activating protein 20 isoform X2 [Sceloporus undulatus]|nr:rho GTPase-activating protein 20 isoform X2 [Sceloporus undulatus]XP_042316098.1 rho GTPase-activating protein 20 isoform X2 [Sceloporus undulatus]XP_042316099.1 rho GTPase-activating protein 20 isoform X2 [Sceloporus undulatus]XP_042316100.1 rho GTPase-activating protein 20 isoform X2 [Sceloporus undulatus]XP_042316101.1 rho GTPase-activating protein 20 isoform X2 [Sceloporus undulatus]